MIWSLHWCIISLWVGKIGKKLKYMATVGVWFMHKVFKIDRDLEYKLIYKENKEEEGNIKWLM